MKVPNARSAGIGGAVSLSRLQNEGSQLPSARSPVLVKSIKATE